MTVRKLVAALIAGAGVLYAAGSAALGLGNVVEQSAVGAPLRIRIQLIGASPALDTECLRLAPGLSQDLPWVHQARLAIERGAAGTSLIVSSARPAYHPILMLGIESGCEGSLRREYTLLLPPNTALAAAVAPKVTAEERPLPPVRPVAKAPAAPSLVQLAREQFPGSRAARRRFIAAARKSAPDLFPNRASLSAPLPAGASLDIERLRKIAAKAPPKRSKPRPARTETPPAVNKVTKPRAKPKLAKAPAPAQAPAADATPVLQPAPGRKSDRLMLFGGEPKANLKLSFTLSSAGRIGATTDEQRERLRREQRLIMTLDEKIMTQMELASRIAELEQLQARLLQESERLDSLAGGPTPPVPDAATVDTTAAGADTTQPSGSVASVEAPAPAAPAQTSLGLDPEQDWQLIAAGVGVLSLTALLALLWRRRREAEYEEVELSPLGPESEIGEPAPDAEVPAQSQLETMAGAKTEAQPPPSADEDPEARFADLEEPEASMDFAPLDWTPPADDLSAQAPAPLAEEELVDEHDSAVELADIMMSFGRVQGAAQTLAEFIRHNPKQGVSPWLKLLDVYRTAGMQTEFEALTKQLNSTFNVKVVSWEDFDAKLMASETLENMPHIVSKLEKRWSTRECQVYLHELLRDNRDGARQGFPIAVVDEILCLLSVLNELVGPFRPQPGDFDDEPAAWPEEDGTQKEAAKGKIETGSLDIDLDLGD